MFQVFARSWKGLNLSPGERAAMKLVEGWLLTALGAGAAIAYQQLTAGVADYRLILPAAGGAALLTLLLSVKKYLAAQTDVPLPAPSQAQPAQLSPAQPGQLFTTPVPQAGGAYVPPPAQFMQPPPGTATTNVQPVYQPFSTMPNIQVPQ
jgi:hypothetical protein